MFYLNSFGRQNNGRNRYFNFKLHWFSTPWYMLYVLCCSQVNALLYCTYMVMLPCTSTYTSIGVFLYSQSVSQSVSQSDCRDCLSYAANLSQRPSHFQNSNCLAEHLQQGPNPAQLLPVSGAFPGLDCAGLNVSPQCTVCRESQYNGV